MLLLIYPRSVYLARQCAKGLDIMVIDVIMVQDPSDSLVGDIDK